MNGLCPNCNNINHGKFCSEWNAKVDRRNKTVQVVQENTKDKGENKEGVTI